MSTSDQQDHGPLTRKQLREIRLTGSTPVITPEEAAAAAEAAPPAPPVPSAPEPVEAEPVEEMPVPDAEETTTSTADEEPHPAAGAPLTRRQVREQERTRTGSVSVVGADDGEPDSDVGDPAARQEAVATDKATAAGDAEVEQRSVIVSEVPDFIARASADTAGDDDDIDDEIVLEPIPASPTVDTVGVVPLEVTEEPADTEPRDDVAAVLGFPVATETEAGTADDDVLADVHEADDDDVVDDPRPTVNPGFGEGLLTDAPEAAAPAAFRPSFDELLTVGDSTGSQHSAPNALIFTPSPGDGSLSGPVASTGEILVTGSYELPRGLGSQGHAHGTTDGKDIDAVLIDGELAPSSSPTPIAASAAVSTIKPAGEVIRPPAPEKGNRLLLILAIVAGGLALAVGTAVIVAFSTNVF
ncbi:hypothetical protein [Microbacterium sp. SA39]|uniref:hypothetical protein n=1 Tax=Microbacterium sp. SA39 TaxID=1263625 RepID=UPI0005FA72D8|nr:hypothetical protein [Microbacterium sp. SA39]KJQ55494.1 hypothetical protein RS85_00556 [Microbacterium sp. SA39]